MGFWEWGYIFGVSQGFVFCHDFGSELTGFRPKGWIGKPVGDSPVNPYQKKNKLHSSPETNFAPQMKTVSIKKK